MIAVPIGGKSRQYNVIDETSGEVIETISRRQYDKRFGVLASEGFNSYEARTRALQYTVQGPFKLARSIHHSYDIGNPPNVDKAIATVLDHSPHFGTKMMLAVEVEVYGEGKPYKRTFGTTVFRKSSYEISFMIKDLFDDIDADYDIEYVILGYSLTLIDKWSE